MKVLVIVFLAAICYAKPLPNARTQKCGQPAIQPSVSSNIVGGTPATPYSWPWQGVLLKNNFFTCSGTILSNNWFMTAGHCVYQNLNAKVYSVKLGVFNMKKSEPGEVVSQFSEVHLHPNFYLHTHPLGGLDNLTNDVALLKFETPINFTDHISPVCVPATLNEPVPADGTLLWETGWGDTREGGSPSDTLQQVAVPIYNFDKCQQICEGLAQPFSIYPTEQFCQGYDKGGKETCNGDSGGPSQWQDPNNNGTWTQLGITSAAVGCARPGYPAVKSKVSAYIDFIEQYVTDL